MCILTELQQRPFFVQLTAHWSSVLSSLSITDQTRSQQCHLFGNRPVLPPNLPEEPPDLLQDPTPATSPSPLCQPSPCGRGGNVPASNHRPFAALRCPLGFELKKRRIRNTQQHFNANNLFQVFQHGIEPHSRKKGKIVSCCLDNACKNKRQ